MKKPVRFYMSRPGHTDNFQLLKASLREDCPPRAFRSLVKRYFSHYTVGQVVLRLHYQSLAPPTNFISSI